jgi:hypothetical protein
MKKLIDFLLIVIYFFILSFYLPQTLRAEQQAEITKSSPNEPIVFEMKYRGLSGAKDEMRYS